MIKLDLQNIITSMLSIIAIIVSIGAIINQFKQASTQFENILRQQINEAQQYKDDKTIELEKAIANKLDTKVVDKIRAVAESAVQRYINVYDDACGKYLNGKINKKTFKDTFEFDIIFNVENINYREYFFGELSQYYKKTLAVYKEWKNKESR